MDKPETPLRQMLRDLTDWGYSQASIARAVDYHKPSICELLSGVTRDLPYAVGVRIADMHAAEVRRRSKEQRKCQE